VEEVDMGKKTLKELAAEMRARLILESGYLPVALSGGLELVLSRAGERWALTLKRPDVKPAPMELEICRRAFGVPEGAGERTFARQMLMQRTRELTLYRGIELSWREVGADGLSG
jgi:hypothetical protein